MVVFTCNHCGESLRKPVVEKHYNFVCRTVKSLTCVDCFKDFREEEYVVHTKCLTEEERYAAKGSMPNGVVKKGELKQESWVDMIKSILEEANLTSSQRNLLSTISTCSNIPRKKPKFVNFIKSSSGGRVNMKDVEDVWNIIESYKVNKGNRQLDSNKRKNNEENLNDNNDSHQPKKKKQNDSDTENNTIGDSNKQSDNSNIEINQSKKKKKKNKLQDQENATVETQNGENNTGETVSTEDFEQTEKFNFQSEIIRILEEKKNVSLKKLQKKAINAYLKHSGAIEVTPKIIKKFNKGLKKISNVEIVDDYISLKPN